MDKATDDFNKSSHDLLEAEIRLNTVNIQIQEIERNIATLVSLEALLDENINVLQRSDIIAIVSEYRKALSDMKITRTKLSLARIERENCLKVQTYCEAMYKKAKKEYEKAFERMRNPLGNVIQGNFGRKKDGQE